MRVKILTQTDRPSQAALQLILAGKLSGGGAQRRAFDAAFVLALI